MKKILHFFLISFFGFNIISCDTTTILLGAAGGGAAYWYKDDISEWYDDFSKESAAADKTDDTDLETLYLSVSDLANSVSKNSTDLAAEPHLRIVIEILAEILWKEDVPLNAKTPSIRTKNFPIEDPDATNCESYGRIIYWLRLLKHHYALTCSTNNKFWNDPTTIEIQKFFMVAISRPQPKNGLDLIKTVLFIFSEVVWYLETVRVRLAPLHNLVIFPGVHQ